MTDDLLADIEKVIRDTVSGRTLMGAVTTSDLLMEIDYRLRIAPSWDLFDAAIGHLLDEGAIGQTAAAQYVDGRSAGAAAAPLPPPGQAGVAHRATWSRTESELPRPGTPVLTAVIPISGEIATAAEWRHAEWVAIVITDALRLQRRSTSVPFVRDAPRRLEFDVLATADDDPQRLFRMVASIFEDAAPAGSELHPILLRLP